MTSRESLAESRQPAAAPPEYTELLALTTGAWVAQAIAVAAELGLADLVVDGPRSADELARKTATHAPTLYRLLRALAGAGVFTEDERGRFGSTPLADGLRSDVPGSVRAACELRGRPWFWQAWGRLLHSVRTGEPALEAMHGTDLLTFLERHPTELSVFDRAMGSLSATEIAAVCSAYDFPAVGTVVDVAGGRGTLLAAVLQSRPALRGILFDRPATVDGAPELLAAAGVADRREVLGGDFFDAVPEGGDLYVLKSIIHDWDDARAAAILRSCRRAMRTDATLVLVERVVPPGNTPSPAKWMDLNMLVLLGGRERTEAEYRELFARAGFDLTRVVTTDGLTCLVEGVPATG
jgi:predicted O-methyltransferase YrrM